MSRVGVRVVVGVLVGVLAGAVWAPGASAAFGGGNGKIYYQDDFDIYSVNVDGTDRVRLTNDVAYDTSPVAAADGAKIAFVSSRSGSLQVWVVNPDGSGLVQVGTDGVVDGGLVAPIISWGPDGRVYYSNHDRAIVSVKADGTGRVSTGITGWDPAVSPNGKRIAYVAPPTGLGNPNLWVSDLTGTNPTRLTNNTSYTSAWHPDWSPDGVKIAFTLFALGLIRTDVVNADGTGLSTLTTGAREYAPQWSPDGTAIAFTVPAEHSVYTVKPDGTGRTRLAASPGGAETSFMVSDWAVAVPPADAAVKLTAAAPASGSRVDYTIDVTNNGPGTLNSATVTLTLPTNVTASSATTGCTAAGSQVTCPVGSLAAGGSTRYAIRTTVGLLALGRFDASAAITGGKPADPAPANNTSVAGCTALLALLITC